MKGKEIPKTNTCEWVKAESVDDLKSNASSLEDFLDTKNILDLFEYRANYILQKAAMELMKKVSIDKMDPTDVWNAA